MSDGRAAVPIARRESVTLGGFHTSFLRAGDEDAPPLVLLHDGAWGGSAAATWGRTLPAFARRYHVIAPDLYGYGESSKVVQFDVAPYEFRLRQVAGLLDALGLQSRPAHMVGASFGGAMVLRGALAPWFSWRMRSGVSIAGTGGPFRTRVSLEELARFDGSRQDMRRIVRLLAGDFDAIDEQVDQRFADAAAPGHFRAVASAAMPTPFGSARVVDPYPESLRGARIPLAFVSGRDDDLVEDHWADTISRHAPMASVHVIDGRHCPSISHPTATAEALLDMLTSCEEAAEASGDGGDAGTRPTGVDAREKTEEPERAGGTA